MYKMLHLNACVVCISDTHNSHDSQPLPLPDILTSTLVTSLHPEQDPLKHFISSNSRWYLADPEIHQHNYLLDILRSNLPPREVTVRLTFLNTWIYLAPSFPRKNPHPTKIWSHSFSSTFW